MAYYVTVADSMAQAANTYGAVQTAPDGSTVTKVAVPQGYSRIAAIGSCVTIDGAHTIDTGNNFTLKLAGICLIDGEQEIHVGTVASQETGASVTGEVTYEGATYQPVDIRVKPGEITVSAAFDGTDPGTPFLAVTLVMV